MALQAFCTLLSSVSVVLLLGGPYRFTRGLLMSLDFLSACSWLLHGNKSGRSHADLPANTTASTSEV